MFLVSQDWVRRKSPNHPGLNSGASHPGLNSEEGWPAATFAHPVEAFRTLTARLKMALCKGEGDKSPVAIEKDKRKRFFVFGVPGLGSAEIAEPSWAMFGGV